MEADDPWQFLAACFEVADAWRSPDPAAYESRLPVQLDGSCNGLQHYAALGRDLDGGMAVNLRPADRPQVSRALPDPPPARTSRIWYQKRLSFILNKCFSLRIFKVWNY